MKWVGLTGGIATGKSTALQLLAEKKYATIDSDKIANEFTKINTPEYCEIVSTFGKSILDDDFSINRKLLANIVFRDIKKRILLEQILHPTIEQEVTKQRNFYNARGDKFCFCEVPLLFEKNLKKKFDFTILVWCSEGIQLARIAGRDKIKDSESRLIISNQMPISEKVKNSDFCIDNSGTKAELKSQLYRLLLKLES